ncbi:sensor histidine kinase [Bordetella hinzii]|uniref:histidine kinase n=1 Tax=Bordetella hinzii TaxID=103855 RepID=A0AAN1RWK5_9BORD|nr:extracellular solute-binding protein [Bordetella hinzii]AZW16612.1 HAMP domain-containing histidine kinase [Bordetella hinzii]MBZ0074094.1 extracellular solute-binding protein [Bordetella hinzii]MBZ0081374.1 extracellular solute-binding protein [Bordetella hinzii]MBZ0083299.1 extracellular solute-binding protein [Bordetella hinzii]QET44823.1 extracellular solute-binding protein [Bordetella hinzii]
MSRHDGFSIRRRVFMLALLSLACASVALFFFLRAYGHRAAEQAFDRLLAASALTIAGSVQIDDSGVTVEPPFSSLAMLPGSERVFYQVLNGTGRAITGYADLAPTLPLADSAVPRFAYERYHDEAIRVATVGRLVSASQHAGWVTVRVAETLGSRQALAAEILNRSLWPLLIVVGVALALLWFGIQRAFAPLAVVERELRHREPDDLAPLRAPVPREVRRLSGALDAFMQRLSAMMDSLNTLVADAAHQVRTPLASLRAQAEVALEEKDPERLRERVARIHQNATQASQLINQLLMDATIAHRLGRGERVAVGVAETVNETRRRIGPLDAQRLRITIAPQLRRARVMGDRVALREMLRNLVDNALRHAPDSLVEIQVTPVAGYRLALTVSDRGPGIPAADRERVQQRFERGASDQPGSGLGLAIVRSVAQAHGGSLWLQDRPGGGLLARVVLPMAQGRARLAAALLAACCLLPGLWPAPAEAAKVVQESRYPAPRPSSRVLTVAGPTDTPVIAPLIAGFQSERPDVTVVYREMNSRELYEEAVAGRLKDVDVLISSAPDLQIRLANDGYALSHASPYARSLPSWAVWRDEVYGFTFEPAVIVYNPRRFTEETAPHSRQALLRLLEREGASLRGRVGTYDIAASNVGYVLAEQDELVSSNFWGLANALGQVGVRLATTSGELLDAIERGELDLGYNLLGSYALARQAAGDAIGVVLPQDYMLVLARSVLIARRAPNPDLGRAMVDWLLSPAGQQVAANHAALGALVQGTPGPWTADALQARARGIVQPIVLSPALLVGLDQQRQSRFVQNWMRLVTDTPDVPGRAHRP